MAQIISFHQKVWSLGYYRPGSVGYQFPNDVYVSSYFEEWSPAAVTDIVLNLVEHIQFLCDSDRHQ